MECIKPNPTPGNPGRLAALCSFLVPALVLSAWSVVMLHTYVTGRTKMLLHPLFQPIIAIAGVLLAILSVAHLCYFLPLPTRRAWMHWLVLLVPLICASIYAPKSFSDQMVAARGIQSSSNALDASVMDANSQKMLQTLSETDPQQPLPMDVVDLVTISGVPVLTQKLENRTLRIRGQLYHLNDAHFKILRLLMFCCAADATPVGVIVNGQPPADTKNMEWVEAEGSVHFVQTLGQVRPEIELHSVQKVPTPTNPYAY